MLVSQIRKRGRAYEMSIQESYLERLNEKYEHWVNHIYKGRVVTLDIDKEDFLTDPSIIDRLISLLQ